MIGLLRCTPLACRTAALSVFAFGVAELCIPKPAQPDSNTVLTATEKRNRAPARCKRREFRSMPRT
jgi:hypothetical protein